MIRTTARVCAAPASNEAVRTDPCRTLFIWTNAAANTSDKSAHNRRNHTPKIRPGLVPNELGK